MRTITAPIVTSFVSFGIACGAQGDFAQIPDPGAQQVVAAVAGGERADCAGVELEPDEYAVLGAVLAARFPMVGTGTVVVEDRTMSAMPALPSAEGPWGPMIDAAPTSGASGRLTVAVADRATTEQAIADLAARAPQAACVGAALRGPGSLAFMRRADREGLFASGSEQGWASFYQRHPDASEYLTLSRVGFDAARTHAVVYVVSSCGSLCASGTFFVVEKRDGAWRVTASRTPWIS